MAQHAQYLSNTVDPKNGRIRYSILIGSLLVSSMVGKGGLEALLDDLTDCKLVPGRSYGYQSGVVTVSDALTNFRETPSDDAARALGVQVATEISQRISARLVA